MKICKIADITTPFGYKVAQNTVNHHMASLMLGIKAIKGNPLFENQMPIPNAAWFLCYSI